MTSDFRTLAPGYSFGGWIERSISDEFGQNLEYDAPSYGEGDSSRYWMHLALIESMTAIGLPPPNPVVGCVFVKDGKIVSKGATRSYGGYHAEQSAIYNAKDHSQLKNATAYVTLEPCSHHGNQPPCSEALIKLGIRRCIIAAGDPHPLVNGRGIAQLRQAGIEVEIGHLKNECIAWNFPFFANQHLGRPIVFAKWAQTLNGFLADDQDKSKWISGSAARSYTHWLRQKYDVIMVGALTAIADQPELTVRNCAPPINRQPLKIVFDPSGRLLKLDDFLQKKLKNSTFKEGGKIIYAVKHSIFDASIQNWLTNLRQENILILRLNDEDPLADIFEQLGQAEVTSFWDVGVQSIFVEGGPMLLTSMMQRDMIDCFHTFINPSFLGGTKNRIANFSDKNNKSSLFSCQNMPRYRLMTTLRLNNDILVEYLPQDRFHKVFGS